MKHCNNVLFQVCLLLWVLISATTVIAADTGVSTGQLVRIDGQHLSVRAIHTPVETILTQIAHQSGIEIFFQGRSDGTVTIDMHRAPLERGVKRLISGHNHAFTYGYDDHDVVVIKQLYIYSKTGLGAMRPMTPKGAAQPLQSTPALVDNGIVIQAQTPADRDPLLSMRAIDPLMKINGAQAPHLPEGFHNDGSHPGDLPGDLPEHADAGVFGTIPK